MLTSAKLYNIGDPDGKSKDPLKNDAKQKNSQTKSGSKRDAGYFDSALEQLRVKLGPTGKVPKFNAEFLSQDQSNLQGTVRKGFVTYRGHARFEFLGPSPNELKGLSNFSRSITVLKHCCDSSLRKRCKPRNQ